VRALRQGGGPRCTRGWPLPVAVALGLLISTPSWAVPGELDSTFGSGGKVTTRFASPSSANSVAIQADGKIVVAGGSGDLLAGDNPKFALARYNPDGLLDKSFGGGDGKVSTDFTSKGDGADAVAIQADGKIVAAGDANGGHVGSDSTFALVRYNSDGSLDTSFGVGGKVVTDFTDEEDAASSLAIQADGKIVAAGWAGSGAEGSSLDPSFALARYNPDGTLDTSFGGVGTVTTQFTPDFDAASSVTIQADGKIVAAGVAGVGLADLHPSFALARYNADGSLDPSFGVASRVTTNFTSGDDETSSVAIQSDGKIVAAGWADVSRGAFALARYNPDGSLDASFGSAGKIITNFTPHQDFAAAVTIQADGRIVAAGGSGIGGPIGGANWCFALARYNPDGSLDRGFGAAGRVTSPFHPGYAFALGVAIQGDRKIVAAGDAGGNAYRFAIARYLPA